LDVLLAKTHPARDAERAVLARAELSSYEFFMSVAHYLSCRSDRS
jgi:hypothetical protein